ncbi:uncharacterized protein C8Q71DRAFT_772010 [Rhodofomes roseus]|uniref:MYND-type domain-containing protein n=1 Tax=Rhodofomes roseus TaxID=34475 RepID=A0ABQ8K8R3_9APHY|nr:uncharacterized protein C8Q71DRAFT_772010 [Rhodofomes roseus]KAH9833665.1 hypothetical protein C8Q71DRAFT_772010 [Rhodofomes roseus]
MVTYCAKCARYATKRCKGCTLSSANYCGRDCQEHDWPEHKFECNAKCGQLDEADRLVRAVHRHHIPDDIDTLEEYGFVLAARIGNLHELFDFWVDFIVTLEIPAKSLRQWRRNRVLCQVIELGYAKTGLAGRSQPFKWYQRHRWIVEPSLGIPRRDVEQKQQAAIARFCRWTGLPDPDHPDIDAIKRTWPVSQKLCFDLCEHIFRHIGFLPPTDIWTQFGFCVCRNDHEVRTLEDVYRRLCQLHTFDEIWLTYEESALGSLVEPLLSSCGWHKREELLDVLQIPSYLGRSMAIWQLKGVIAIDSDTYLVHESHLPLSKLYGFCNAESIGDIRELKRLYRRLLWDANIRPLRLHEIAVKGELYRFAKSILGFGKREKEIFGWLLGEIVEESVE